MAIADRIAAPGQDRPSRPRRFPVRPCLCLRKLCSMDTPIPHRRREHPGSDADLKGRLRRRAWELGLDDLCFTTADELPHADFLAAWLEQGHAGTMRYLCSPARHRPVDLLPGARTILVACVRYARSPRAPHPLAAYAQRDDYHRRLRTALQTLATELQALRTGSETRVVVDTAPLLEREAATRAGLGWIGKSTMLIHLQYGAFTLLGELLWTEPVAPDSPALDRCAECTACMDACPTGALSVPYRMDPQRCISYWTIEHRGPIPSSIEAELQGRAFGCDACLEACPFGGRAVEQEGRLLPSQEDLRHTDLESLDQRARARFWKSFGHTPLERARKRGMLRNLGAARRSLERGLGKSDRVG